MKILICGPEGSGKTTLAKPFAKLLDATYVTKESYANELRGYCDGLVAAGKTVVIDKRCNTNASVEYLDPDYIVWMDTIKKGRLSTFDKTFQIPKKFDLKIKTKNLKINTKKVINFLEKLKLNKVS